MRTFFTQSLILAIILTTLPSDARAQDLVATESIARGSSVFVFPRSSKQPQARAGGGRVTTSGASGGMGGGAQRVASIKPKKRAVAPVQSDRSRQAEAVARARTRSNALTNSAEKYLDDGKYDLAINDFRAALTQLPTNSRASLGLSDALTGKGNETLAASNNSAAIPLFDEAIKLDPANGVAYAKLGAIYESAGDNARAINHYEKALSLDPTFTTVLPGLAAAYFESGDIAKAENYLDRSESAGLVTAEVRFIRGVLLYKQNNNASALAQFDRVVELEPFNAAAHYHRGLVLERLGAPDRSIEAFNKVLEIDPNNSAAMFDLAVAAYNKGDYDAALTSYQRLVTKEPKNFQAHANLGSTLRQLGRCEEANASFSAAEAGLKSADLYTEWGFCLGQSNKWDNATAKLEKANELTPGAAESSNVGWAYYNYAASDQANKDEEAARPKLEKAKEFLQRAVEIDAKLDAAYVNLGSTNNSLGNFAEAVSVLKIALSLRSDWPIALTQIGFGYRGLRDFKNAINAFKRVADLDPRNARALFDLGDIYFAAGNKKEAQKIRAELAKIDPAMASQLDNVIAGRVVDATRRKIESKIPRPRIPF
jgi:tetratricopeptide (TPR) repeat protein